MTFIPICGSSMHFQDAIPLREYSGWERNVRVQKVIAGDYVFRECSNVFWRICEAMVSLFNVSKSDSLASLRYSFTAKKVATSKTFVTPEKLPRTTSATHLHSRRTYLEVMNGWERMTACNLLNGAGQCKWANLSHSR